MIIKCMISNYIYDLGMYPDSFIKPGHFHVLEYLLMNPVSVARQWKRQTGSRADRKRDKPEVGQGVVVGL